jgi:hypothetical protein
VRRTPRNPPNAAPHDLRHPLESPLRPRLGPERPHRRTVSYDLLPRELAKAALAYAAHQSARCAHPAAYGDCACGDDEFRRQAHLALGHELCPGCLGAKEVVVDRPPHGPDWEPCPHCDGLGNVPPEHRGDEFGEDGVELGVGAPGASPGAP